MEAGDASLAEYSRVKLLLLKLSHGEPLSEAERRVLQRYGARNLLELERVAHELHLLVDRITRFAGLKLRGDALVLAGLLEAYGSHIEYGEGDGRIEPAQLVLDAATVLVQLEGDRRAIVWYELDIPIDEVSYGLLYIPRVRELIERARREIRVENDTISIPATEAAELAFQHYATLGLQVVGIPEETSGWYRLAPVGPADLEELADELAEILAVYDWYITHGIPRPQYPLCAWKLEETLRRVAGELEREGVSASLSRPTLTAVHHHEEELTVHVHIGGRIEVAARPTQLLPATARLIAELDRDWSNT